MSTIVVMDIGKTNAKLCVVDAANGELLNTESTATPSLDKTPYLHLDTSTLWQWYLLQLKRTASKYQISCIVVTAHGATAALVTDTELALPVMDYEFDGPDSLAEEYNQRCDPFEHTYSPHLPHGLNVGRQLYWQRKYYPGQFKKAVHLLPYTQFWSWKLTGIATAEVTTIGSHSDLWNPLAKTYSDFSIRENFATLFPALRKADDVLGTLAPEVLAQTGISHECKVLVGIHDSNASLIPWLKTKSTPFTVMSTGTWVIIFALGAPLQGLKPERDCTANVNIHSEPVACGRFMGGREFSAIAGEEGLAAANTTTAKDLQDIIDHNIFALPAFADTGGPFSGQQGTIETDNQLTPAQHFALASVYCALTSDESLTLCGSRGDILVEGAFAKNTLLMQCLAVFRTATDNPQDILASSDSTGTTLGAAMLASNRIAAPSLTPVPAVTSDLTHKLLEYRRSWHQRIAQRTAQLKRDQVKAAETEPS